MMKVTWVSAIIAAGLLLSNGPVRADGLMPLVASDDAADVIFDVVCTGAWVDVSGNSEPFWGNGAGAILVDLVDGHSVQVETSPNARRANLNCFGRLPFGEQVMATDIVTGEMILATLATRDEACEAITTIFPDVCRGNNGPAIITYETSGLQCFVTIDGVDYFTVNHLGVTTTSGQSSINCHFDLD